MKPLIIRLLSLWFLWNDLGNDVALDHGAVLCLHVRWPCRQQRRSDAGIPFCFWSCREKTVENLKRMTNFNEMNRLYYQRLTICLCVPFNRTSSGFKRPVFIPHTVNSRLISCLTFGCSYVLVSSEGHIHGCVALTNNRRLWCSSDQPSGSKGLTHKDKKNKKSVYGTVFSEFKTLLKTSFIGSLL